MKYNHAISIAFSIDSDNEQPTDKEMWQGITKRLHNLMESGDTQEACDIYDTVEEK